MEGLERFKKLLESRIEVSKDFESEWGKTRHEAFKDVLEDLEFAILVQESHDLIKEVA